MDELLVGLQAADPVKLFLEEVFNRLHVVVGRLLYFLYPCRRSLVEVAVDVTQRLEERTVETFQLRQGQLAQRDEILDFDTYPVTDEGILGKIVGKVFGLVSVATVNGRDGC